MAAIVRSFQGAQHAGVKRVRYRARRRLQCAVILEKDGSKMRLAQTVSGFVQGNGFHVKECGKKIKSAGGSVHIIRINLVSPTAWNLPRQ